MAKEARDSGFNWFLLLRAVFWICLILSAGAAARAVSQLASNDPHFVLDRDAGVAANSPYFQIYGLEHASLDHVLRIFEDDFGRNIFQIPIAERRRKLLAVDWIERASVSRIWPNRLTVRVWERKPVAFVNLTPPGARNHTSQLVLIDEYGVILNRPERLRFSAPILSGLYESQTEEQRRDRLRHYLRLMDELGPLASQVSEVDLSEPANLQVTVNLEGRAVYLAMGDRNFKRRLQDFLDHYPEIRRKSAGAAVFDLRLDDRITSSE
jgi:cell division protein FtsQ